MTVRTGNQKGWIKKSAKVFTNDPQKPEVTVDIQGNLWVPIVVHPERVHFKGLIGEDLVQNVFIEGQKEEPLKLEDVSVSIPNKVSFDVSEQPEKGTYVLTFENKVNKEDMYWGQAILTTNYPDHPQVKIPIMGAIQSVFQVRPKVLTFPPLSQSRFQARSQADEKTMSRALEVSLKENGSLKIEEVHFDKSLFEVVRKEAKSDRGYRLWIKPNVAKLSRGQVADVLTIETNQAHEKAIRVPVYVTVTE